MANWSGNAEVILASRYLLKDKKGNVIETGDELLSRVARYIASAEKESDREKWYNEYMSILDTLEFLPNSPTLMNAGKPNGQLSACFVLDIQDDLSNIFETVKQCALIHKTGGGTGLIFSKIRPANSIVQSTSGVASGPVSFMQVFNSATEAVKQGGVRRGANLGLLHISHPDIFDFVSCKSDLTKFPNFNISVGVTDNFMKAVKQDNGYPLRHPRISEKKYVKAQELYNEICRQAWTTGDPGLLFLDTIEARNPTPWFGRLEGVNPCIVGDTLIAVADGRNAVSIKQLAEESKDVPVYSQDLSAAQNGEKKTVIKMGRNFRKTVGNSKIFKVILDDGSFIKATENHNFMMRTGEYRELKDLVIGDSLMPFNTEIQNGYVTINSNDNYWKRQFRMMWEFQNGSQPRSFDIHHKDYNKKNDSWEKVHNHKVISVDFCGYEEVYNLTVDDTHNYMVVTDYREDGSSTGICIKNCGETPLIPGESCNLGSIDLSKMVQENGKFNWDRLNEVVSIAVRFLDGLIDVNHFPNVKIKRATERTRKLGLGVMGFADALILMNIKYNSDKAQKFAERLIMNIRETAHIISRDLGKEKGFGELKKLKRRNATLTVIAPTGTLSMLANCSSGIEPLFAKKFTKTVLDGTLFDLSSKYREIDDDLLVTAHDISVFDHIKIQAAFQTYTDGAVSKTINLSSNASEEDVQKAFMFAWETGCKGITVFRDGSRAGPLEIIDQGITECANGRCNIL
jgi:ribonucleoside-diphosphate reductase alpha chain